MGRTIDLPHARLILLNARRLDDAQLAAALPSDPITGWVSDARSWVSAGSRLGQCGGSSGDPHGSQIATTLEQHPNIWLDYSWVENAVNPLAVMARHGNVRVKSFRAMPTCWMCNRSPWVGNSSTTSSWDIEHPVAWVHLTLTDEALNLSVRLPTLPDCAVAAKTPAPVNSGEMDSNGRWKFGIISCIKYPCAGYSNHDSQ